MARNQIYVEGDPGPIGMYVDADDVLSSISADELYAEIKRRGLVGAPGTWMPRLVERAEEAIRRRDAATVLRIAESFLYEEDANVEAYKRWKASRLPSPAKVPA